MAIVITDGIHYLKFVDGELATTRKLELIGSTVLQMLLIS